MEKEFYKSVTFWAIISSLIIKVLTALGFIEMNADTSEYEKMIIQFGPLLVGGVVDLVTMWGRACAKEKLVLKVAPKADPPAPPQEPTKEAA